LAAQTTGIRLFIARQVTDAFGLASSAAKPRNVKELAKNRLEVVKIGYLGRSTPPNLGAVSEKIVAEDLACCMEEFRLPDQAWLWLKARDNKSE
jgi:hypothetical protein